MYSPRLMLLYANHYLDQNRGESISRLRGQRAGIYLGHVL
jgi:hypothetical protein